TEHAARLDAHALGVEVALDAPGGHDLEVPGAADVAGHLPGDDHVAAGHVAADHPTLADVDSALRDHAPLDRAVDAERAVGLQVPVHHQRSAEHVLDLISARAAVLFFRAPCHLRTSLGSIGRSRAGLYTRPPSAAPARRPRLGDSYALSS